jgi:hypothetical protein
MQQVINLTPHTVTVVAPSGATFTYPPSFTPARVSVDAASAPALDDGCPTCTMVRGDVTGLPAPGSVAGALYIVSRMVADASPDRGDLLVPGAAIRDANNAVVGCTSLVRQ